VPPDSTPPDVIHQIAGSDALVQWFGFWPGFHDAEVVSIELNRNGTSCVRVWLWETTKEVDPVSGCFIQTKHVIVSFFLTGLKDIDLAGFSSQNVIFGLDISRTQEGLQMLLEPCYGVTGTITAGAISIKIRPGKPEDTHQQ
jgi:Immunity protein 50